MNDKDLKKLRDLVAIEIKNALRFVTMQQGTTSHKLDMVYERLDKIEEKVDVVSNKQDAALVDIHDIQTQIKGLWDWTKEIKERQDRRFKEIKEDLGLPSN